MSGYRIGEIFRRKGFTYRCVPESIVTEPEEGMLFRASNGVLFELKAFGSTDRKCGCHLETSDALPCYAIDCQAFGTRVNRFHWYPVEEKREEKEMEEEKRHIELAVVKVDGDKVTFKISEQTHRCDDFTTKGPVFKSRSGYLLNSKSCPDEDAGIDRLFVRGWLRLKDDTKVTANLETFARIMEAITEYNETNGLGYNKLWPRTGDLYYYVDTDGSVESCQYADKYDIDNNRRKAGNFFKTKEAAEIAAERVKEAFKTLVVSYDSF